MPIGPPAEYLVKYNGYTLPGYLQNEGFDSIMNIADHYAAYADGSNSEYTGLGNKEIPLRLKVWEQDYLTCKEQVRLAATYLRSSRGYAPLYVQSADKHYEAQVVSIKTEKEAGTSVRTLEYEVSFRCKPWLIKDAQRQISGTGTITTDSVSRTINDGGWTPTLITVTGTNVTVSGYTATDFTGYFSVSGAVSSLVVDSENYTAKIGSTNKNNVMKTIDYRVYVGPGKTSFAITGASSCTIKWYDRWYI